MTERIERIKVGNLLIHEVSKDIDAQIITFSTCLIGIRKSKSTVVAELAGSGTFVFFEDKYCILTAHHVIDYLKKYEALGLGLLTSEHNWYEMLDKLQVVDVGVPNPKERCKGPDLSVIVMPHNRIGQIKANKAFYNINRGIDEVLKSRLTLSEELWCLSGHIGEWTNDELSSHNFPLMKSFNGMVGYGGVQREYFLEAFDYLEAEVKYEQHMNLPRSFGGLSGGGLWRVPLYTDNGKLKNKSPILSGVAFYQTEMLDDKRRIRCHGRRSIYEKVIEALKRVK